MWQPTLPHKQMSIIPISSTIIPNCCIGNFGSACWLDGNFVCFVLKQASDTDKAIVANATIKADGANDSYKANEADEAKADEADEAIVANEAADTDEAYLAFEADVAEAIDAIEASVADEAKATNKASVADKAEADEANKADVTK